MGGEGGGGQGSTFRVMVQFLQSQIFFLNSLSLSRHSLFPCVPLSHHHFSLLSITSSIKKVSQQISISLTLTKNICNILFPPLTFLCTNLQHHCQVAEEGKRGRGEEGKRKRGGGEDERCERLGVQYLAAIIVFVVFLLVLVLVIITNLLWIHSMSPLKAEFFRTLALKISINDRRS